jgi:hypothetical protein
MLVVATTNKNFTGGIALDSSKLFVWCTGTGLLVWQVVLAVTANIPEPEIFGKVSMSHLIIGSAGAIHG